MDKEWDAKSIAANMDASFETEGPYKKVQGISSLSDAEEQDLTFCAWDGEKGTSAISHSRAGIILCKKSLQGTVRANSTSQLIFLENPRLAFVHFVNKIREDDRLNIDSSGRNEPVKIGRNCRIGSLAVIGKNCIIGDDVIVEDRASLKNCQIGDGCIIQSGVAIGSDGFAYERHPNGDLERFPHLGRVVIGKNVEICANTSIARGSLGDTTIGDGTKMDALVHVAHNVKIGNNCQLAAGTIIGGSTVVGNSCWTGLNSTLKNQIRVGNAVLVAAGACVINDLPDGEIVAGVPAKSIKNKVSSNELFIMTGNKSLA